MDIARDTYVKANDEDARGITFDLLTGLHKKIDMLHICYDSHKNDCDGRFKRLENRKKLDTVISGATGVFGGFIAQISGWFK